VKEGLFNIIQFDIEGRRVLDLFAGTGQLGIECLSRGAASAVFVDRRADAVKLIKDNLKTTELTDRARVVSGDSMEFLKGLRETFDLIFHPVSNCYVEEVRPIFRECCRILKENGVLLCGLDNGINFVFDETETEIKFSLPFNPLKDPVLYEASVRENWGIQFSHTLEEQIGGQLEAGFRLTDLYEDTNGIGNLHEHNIPSFWATRAVKSL